MSFFDTESENYRQAMMAEGSTLCSYLVALAAVQRGLNVEFISQVHRHKLFRGTPPSFIPAYFRLSDSKGREVYFDRSRGEKSLVAASINSSNKFISKEIFQRAGVSVADGIQCNKDNVDEEVKKLRNKDAVFIAKPVKGSLGAGVVLGLTLKDAVEHVKSQKKDFIIEQMISGPEFRVAVVDGRAVSSFERLSPSVVGDGRKTIRALVEELNARLRVNPHSRTSLINLDKLLLCPALTGKTMDFVPKFLEKIVLSEKNFDTGREIKHATDYVPAAVTEEAVKAANIIGLPNCGIDVLYDPEISKAYVLEANPRHHLGGHTFPTIGRGDGLAVPSAIIDFYFPQTKMVRPDPEFGLDFSAVNEAMNTMNFDSVRPVSRQLDWVKRIVKIAPSRENSDKIKKFLRLMCMYVAVVREGSDECVLAAYFDKDAYAKILKRKKKTKEVLATPEIDRQIFGINRQK
ncbi:hypothetical protein [Nioella ostreopsis]|uniref:hypothetical protein n=1 Tax=Nioella ostreopsis TaxID=2448479 RepID=UPI000FDB2DB5|nr:hypothetical protein [Nioella ostreopsis]